MEMRNESLVNQRKLARVEEAWQTALNEVLRAGFNGMATIQLTIQDGTIQRIARSVERFEK